MQDDERIGRLKLLISELERLPASKQRDRALWEARARVIALDTGPQTSAWRDHGQPELDWNEVFSGAL